MSLKRKIRVLHLIDHLNTGGGQRYLFDLCRYSDIEDCLITVCALRANGKMEDMFKDIGYPPVYLGHRLPRIVVGLYKLLRKGDFDVIHTHLELSAMLGSVFGCFFQVPIRIVTVNANICQWPWGKYYLFKGISPFVTRFLSRWHSTKTDLLRVGVQEKKIIRIVSGIDKGQIDAEPTEAPNKRVQEILRKAGIKEGDFVLLSISRLKADRKVDVFVRSIIELSEEFPGLKLIVVGNGSEKEYLEKMARDGGVEDRVLFLGYHQELAEFYHISDIFLTISAGGFVGYSGLDANRLGVPILALELDNKCNLSGVQSQENRVFFNVLAKDNFQESLKKLIKDRILRKELISLGREHFRSIPDVQETAERVCLQYGALLEEKGAFGKY